MRNDKGIKLTGLGISTKTEILISGQDKNDASPFCQQIRARISYVKDLGASLLKEMNITPRSEEKSTINTDPSY